MQRKSTIWGIFSFAICICLFFASCSKTGPVGPAGATGSQGVQGAPGPQGPQGNANVFVDTLTLVNSQWAWNDDYAFTTGSGSYQEWFTRYDTVVFPAVTPGVLDSGMVLVYMIPFQGSQQWESLPYEFNTGNGYAYDFVYTTAPGKVALQFYWLIFTTTATPPTLSTFDIPTYKFKIIAVTGTISASMRNQLVSANDYGTAAKILGL